MSTKANMQRRQDTDQDLPDKVCRQMEYTVHGGQTDMRKRMALTNQGGILTVFRMGMMSPGQLMQGEGQKKE